MSLLSALGAIGSAIANPISQLIANKQNANNVKSTNAMNYKIHQEDNAFQKEMWNLNNEYNSPANHMQRLIDAGINPLYDSAYGGDVSSAVSSASPISMQSPYVNPVDFGGFGDIALKQAQIDNLNADTHKKGAETEYTRALTKTTNDLRDLQIADLGAGLVVKFSQARFNDASANKVGHEILNLDEQTSLLRANIIKVFSDIDVSQRQMRLNEIAQSFAQYIGLSNLAQQQQIIAIKWFEANIANNAQISQAKVNDSIVTKNNADADLAKAQTNLVNAQTTSVQQQNALNQPNVDFINDKDNRDLYMKTLLEKSNLSYNTYHKLSNVSEIDAKISDKEAYKFLRTCTNAAECINSLLPDMGLITISNSSAPVNVLPMPVLP